MRWDGITSRILRNEKNQGDLRAGELGHQDGKRKEKSGK